MTTHTCPECNGTGDVGGVEWDGAPAVLPCRTCNNHGVLTSAEVTDFHEWGSA